MTKATRWMVSSMALLILASPGAMAQATVEGWYAEVGGGLSLMSDPDATVAGSGLNMEFDEGFLVSGALGRQFQNVHVEMEGFYFQNDVNRIGGSRNVTGDVSGYGGMGNVYYDFDFGGNWRPYVGGGFGILVASFNDVSGPGLANTDDNDTALAYQLRAGISWSLNSAMDFLLDYRYFITEELDFWSSAGSVTTQIDRFEQHGIQAKIRIRY